MEANRSGSLTGIRRHDYLPFGEELVASTGAQRGGIGYEPPQSSVRRRFTGKERDSETGLDFFEARYLGNTQGRFTSVDPYNPIVDTRNEEAFNEYLGQPQNWNRYAYVWNNPLKYTDPTGENVYVVTYTTGNSVGDDEFRRAAETRAEEIRKQKGFDPKKDTVLVRGVYSKQDFKDVLKEANGLEKQYGKVEQVSLYAHAGTDHGPVLHNPQTGKGDQFTQQELSSLRVNWSGSASAYFYGCHTGVNFAQNFANAQGVPTYGYNEYAYFSSKPDKREGPNATGPLYLIAADGWANSVWGEIRNQTGNARVFPLVRRDPPPKDKPRR